MFIWGYLLIIFQLSAIIQARGQQQDDIYVNDPNIYELTPSNFDKVVHKTNYTSIVKFYAPWCGYCQQLKPVYQKLAKLINKDGQYAINVATVNCDKAYNKELCSKYQISGFPTLLVFRPPKYDSNRPSKKYRHAVETYNGERTLKAITSFITSRIKNYVKKFPNLKSDGLKEWFEDDNGYNKVLLITQSQQISPMFKSLAIDFLNSTNFGMVSTKSVTVDKLDINSKEIEIPKSDLPILLNYKNGEFIKYDTTEKLNNKVVITEWLIKENGEQPVEGQLSKKDIKYYSNYRLGKKGSKSIVHDEL